MRNAYPTISIAVPTTTVLKYQVRWRSSRDRWAASPMAKSTTPKTPIASDGVYLDGSFSFGLDFNLLADEVYPYMMMLALDSVIGFGKFGSM
jgi:hypothetical protein